MTEIRKFEGKTGESRKIISQLLLMLAREKPRWTCSSRDNPEPYINDVRINEQLTRCPIPEGVCNWNCGLYHLKKVYKAGKIRIIGESYLRVTRNPYNAQCSIIKIQELT